MTSSLGFDTYTSQGLGIIDIHDFDGLDVDEGLVLVDSEVPASSTLNSPVRPSRPNRPLPVPPTQPAFAPSPSNPTIHNSEPTSTPSSPLRTDRAQSLPVALVPLNDTEPLRPHRSSSDPDTPTVKRKFSRKLPPKLTESLELLALYPGPTSTSAPTPDQLHSGGRVVLDVDIPADSLEPPSPRSPNISLGQEKEKVSPNKLQKRPSVSSTTMPSSSTARRILSAASLRPSSSSSNGSHLVTPSSSIRDRFSYDAEGHLVSCSSGSASTCGTWSMDGFDEPHRSGKNRESRKAKKERKQAEKAAFDVNTPPPMRSLYDASLLDVIGEDGQKVKFGDLVRRGTTIVVFIRHWFCPLCAQYMKSIVDQVTPEALEEADVELVIIGNGSQKMLPAYKTLKCPFKMYTDPTLQLYRALGLTRQTGNAGPDSEAGDYLVQTPMQATLATMKRATQMPLLANPGHFTQLGGEFIFNGTLNVSYTHRMVSTRAHSPIRDICAEAGVRLEWIHYEPGSPPPPVHRFSYIPEDDEEGNGLDNMDEERQREEEWKSRRDDELARIQAMKEARRMGMKHGDMRREVKIVGDDEDSVEEMRTDFGRFEFA